MEATKVMQHLIGKTYKEVIENLKVEEDYGGCCGWSECCVNDELVSAEDKEKAILYDAVRIDYAEEYSDRVVINFVFDLGQQKGLILGYDMSAGSGSGCSYGAYCTLYYGDEEVAGVHY